MTARFKSLVGRAFRDAVDGTDNPAFQPDKAEDARGKKSSETSESIPGSLRTQDGLEGRGSTSLASAQPQTGHSQYSVRGSVGAAERLHDFDDENEDEERPWDVFEETAWENPAHANRRFWSRVHFVCRVVLIALLFLVVLASSCVSTLVFTLIVYNMDASVQNFTLGNRSSLPLVTLKGASSQVNVHWVWAALILTSAPHFFTLCGCIHKLCVKKTRSLAWRPLITALGLETAHSVGLGVFVYLVAPAYDPVTVILLSQAVGVLPALLRLKRVKRSEVGEEIRFSWLNLLVLLLTGVYIGLLVYLLNVHAPDDKTLAVAVPLCLVFLSVEWWENFVPVKDGWKKSRRYEQKRMRRAIEKNQKPEKHKAGNWLFRAKYAIRDRRTKIETVTSAWKLTLNLATAMVVLAGHSTDCVSALFFSKGKADDCTLWGNLTLSTSTLTTPENKQTDDDCSTTFPFVCAIVGILTNGVAYKMAKVACKIHAQRLCFSLPLLLSAPLSLAIALALYTQDVQANFSCKSIWPNVGTVGADTFLKAYVVEYWLPIFFLGLGLLAVTTQHVWVPSAERVASTDKLFVKPLYCGAVLAQSMLLNRAVDDNDQVGPVFTTAARVGQSDWTSRFEKKTEEFADRVDEEMNHHTFPKIYACATMWHETPREMAQLLKSLFRMDRDQFTRACMWRKFNVVDKDFYNYEAHIFFDDAFTKTTGKNDDDRYAMNTFVKQFLEAFDEAAKSSYPPNVSVSPPVKTDAPYGGRLTYLLPGNNNLVVHLKNKDLIRHKKRWSQVMYMYYLLSYKLLLGSSGVKTKLRTADNTYLLALDGDVDFYPDAVQLLVDRMKRNPHVGAACGRIHPIGSGPMVWYQKFEYAVSHWLQKATEHVFGCVLCSPGCFSLFRGSALMADNVLRTYTKVATTAREAVQYDMGEDRWLCTLLLQQGKRVEYAAAADALTFCPDDFGEYFKQRRRWTPSTMANILDLLSSWKHVIKVNSSISMPFIFYQGFLFFSSVLTPGTIFLLILGAINTAYPTLPLYGAMLLNLLPVVVFIVLCFYAPHDTQINYASLLAVLYSLLMMVVLVGLLRQIAESGMCSITAVFFVGVASIFVLAALLHPQEIWNLVHGLLYFLAIPATSMLLIFYAVINLNVVTWGTRDTNKATAGSQPPKGRLDLLKKMVSSRGGVASPEDNLTSDYAFSFGNLFRCICCPTKRENDSILERFEGLEATLHDLRRLIRGRQRSGGEDELQSDEERGGWGPPFKPGGQAATAAALTSMSPWGGPPLAKAEGAQNLKHFSELTAGILDFEGGDRRMDNPLFDDNASGVEVDHGYDVFEKRYWFDDPKLEYCELQSMDEEEVLFWNQLIKKYLTPLDRDPDNKEKEKKMEEDLSALRNKSAMFFFLSNALFVTIIFILETVSEYTPGLTIELPCDRGHAGQKIEPISITFTVIFGILLLLQLVGMLMHRFSTFVHIVAATSLSSKKTASDDENFRVYGSSDYYDMTMWMIDSMSAAPRSINSSISGPSSVYTDGSMSGDTVIPGGPSHRNNVRELVKRQTVKAEKTTNMMELVDDNLQRTIHALEINSQQLQQQQQQQGLDQASSEHDTDSLNTLDSDPDEEEEREEEEGAERSGDPTQQADNTILIARRPGGAPTPWNKLLWSHRFAGALKPLQDPEERKRIATRNQATRTFKNAARSIINTQRSDMHTVGGLAQILMKEKKNSSQGDDNTVAKTTDQDERPERNGPVSVSFNTVTTTIPRRPNAVSKPETIQLNTFPPKSVTIAQTKAEPGAALATTKPVTTASPASTSLQQSPLASSSASTTTTIASEMTSRRSTPVAKPTVSALTSLAPKPTAPSGAAAGLAQPAVPQTLAAAVTPLTTAAAVTSTSSSAATRLTTATAVTSLSPSASVTTAKAAGPEPASPAATAKAAEATLLSKASAATTAKATETTTSSQAATMTAAKATESTSTSPTVTPSMAPPPKELQTSKLQLTATTAAATTTAATTTTATSKLPATPTTTTMTTTPSFASSASATATPLLETRTTVTPSASATTAATTAKATPSAATQPPSKPTKTTATATTTITASTTETASPTARKTTTSTAAVSPMAPKSLTTPATAATRTSTSPPAPRAGSNPAPTAQAISVESATTAARTTTTTAPARPARTAASATPLTSALVTRKPTRITTSPLPPRVEAAASRSSQPERLPSAARTSAIGRKTESILDSSDNLY